MIKQILIISLVYIVFSNSLMAQFEIKNATDEPILVAMARYENSYDFKGWTSRGWWELVPGESKYIIGWIKFTGGTVYLHAFNDSWTWGKTVSLWVSKYDSFEIKNCDMEYHKNNKDYLSRKFFKLSTGDTKSYTYTFK
jgi:uncharacterized membrane protein